MPSQRPDACLPAVRVRDEIRPDEVIQCPGQESLKCVVRDDDSVRLDEPKFWLVDGIEIRRRFNHRQPRQDRIRVPQQTSMLRVNSRAVREPTDETRFSDVTPVGYVGLSANAKQRKVQDNQQQQP